MSVIAEEAGVARAVRTASSADGGVRAAVGLNQALLEVSFNLLPGSRFRLIGVLCEFPMGAPLA